MSFAHIGVASRLLSDGAEVPMRRFLVVALLAAGCMNDPQPKFQAATPCDDGTDLGEWPDMAQAASDLAQAQADLAQAQADLAQAPPDLAQASPPDMAQSTLFVDNFDSAASLANYSDVNPARHSTLGVSGGWLSITPTQWAYNGWYSENQGVYLARSVSGNFVAEAALRAGRVGNASLAPTSIYSAVGILARDPASSSPGNQSWLVYNLGFQDNHLARESKNTRPNPGGPSLSTLYLNNTDENSARLRLCRVGDSFRLYHRHPSEASWVEEQYTIGSTRPGGNGGNPLTQNGALGFTRTMPALLQVGIMANGWGSPNDILAQVDSLMIRPVATLADCTAN